MQKGGGKEEIYCESWALGTSIRATARGKHLPESRGSFLAAALNCPCFVPIIEHKKCSVVQVVHPSDSLTLRGEAWAAFPHYPQVGSGHAFCLRSSFKYLKTFSIHKFLLCMVTDVNSTYRGDHFIIHTNIKLLCCISEMNIALYANYTSIKNTYLTSTPQNCQGHQNQGKSEKRSQGRVSQGDLTPVVIRYAG